MNYEFLDNSIERENIFLPNSDKINPFLLRNNHDDILKAIDFFASDETFLYLHGFMGTGKRQFVNYICDFLHKDVIKLEYYCKEATVCDDVLLAFIDTIEKLSISKAVNVNAKVTTLNIKFKQLISSIKKPFLIVLHSFDDVLADNVKLLQECFSSISQDENVKLIVTTRALNTDVMGDLDIDRKILLKGLSEDIFKDFILDSEIKANDKAIEDFYKITRGYYYYLALAIKIIQAMDITLSEFIQKQKQSEMDFDSYLGVTYLNLVPTTIRNFFWFLRTVRHGISLNALAIHELYDEFSLEYLKSNLMIFQSGENIYVQDYFLQKIDISIPEKTQIKLHKFIIGIYEKQLKETLQSRSINISRQALRAEIEYHNECILNIKNKKDNNIEKEVETVASDKDKAIEKNVENVVTIPSLLKSALELSADKKYTDAIGKLLNILEYENIDLTTLIEVRSNLAKLYKLTGDYSKSVHYYELLETYYVQHKEFFNLNYLYYDLTDVYYKMYKNERAVDTIKKVIYSVDTPQSLMVASCTLLGNIYSDMNKPDEAYTYYKKALDSLDDNVEADTLAELYFKYALSSDDRGQLEEAYEYYNKCIAISENNSYKALAYSNLASCYYENESFDDARACFNEAYNIEKTNNNYDGIYYTASKLAQIYMKDNSKLALEFLLEAKRSAEFVNEELYVIESTIALGDYYYSKPNCYEEALKEYFKAYKVAERSSARIEFSVIEKRINDMKLRMNAEMFLEIERKYAQ